MKLQAFVLTYLDNYLIDEIEDKIGKIVQCAVLGK